MFGAAFFLTKRIIMLSMSAFHGHDDDFLYEYQRDRTLLDDVIEEWHIILQWPPQPRPGFCNPAKKIEDMLNVPAATPWKT
jgi:hypothetical protein